MTSKTIYFDTCSYSSPFPNESGSGPSPSINLQQKSQTISTNTLTTITPDQGYDGLSSVAITTSVTPSPPIITQITYTTKYQGSQVTTGTALLSNFITDSSSGETFDGENFLRIYNGHFYFTAGMQLIHTPGQRYFIIPSGQVNVDMISLQFKDANSNTIFEINGMVTIQSGAFDNLLDIQTTTFTFQN